MNKMDKKVIEATRRTLTGKQVSQLRREGKLPAVLYGYQFDSTPIVLDRRTATKTLHGVSHSTLITIDLEGSEHNVLVREIQRDFIRGDLLHVDFQIVSMTDKIKATVPVMLEGTSPAVDEFNGVVISGVSQLDVEALPQDLPENITVDISELNHIGDGIYVRDLVIPINVAVLTDKDEMVAIISAGTAEEPEEVEEVETELEEPEVIERGKHEDEEEGEQE
jgi:large subunit ribosomal protein L25